MIQLNLIVPASNEIISAEIKKLEEQIYLRQQEIEILTTGVRHYISQCKHVGQKTGYNDRDGSWANPCPTCGHSY